MTGFEGCTQDDENDSEGSEDQDEDDEDDDQDDGDDDMSEPFSDSEGSSEDEDVEVCLVFIHGLHETLEALLAYSISMEEASQHELLLFCPGFFLACAAHLQHSPDSGQKVPQVHVSCVNAHIVADGPYETVQ